MRRITLFFCASIIAACTASETRRAIVTPLEAESESTEVASRISVESPLQGVSVEGRPLLCSVYGSGEETVMILGGIHGNEPASAVLARELCAYLEQHPDECGNATVVVAPAVNPDGLAHGKRTNARGVDLNRNFDASNRRNSERFGYAPLSEPESQYIAALIERYQPDRMVSLHQPIACVDWDGPAEDLARAVSEASGLPMKKLGARSGSLGSYAGEELDIPVITIELPGKASSMDPEEVWRHYGMMLRVVIQYPTDIASQADGQ